VCVPIGAAGTLKLPAAFPLLFVGIEPSDVPSHLTLNDAFAGNELAENETVEPTIPLVCVRLAVG